MSLKGLTLVELIITIAITSIISIIIIGVIIFQVRLFMVNDKLNRATMLSIIIHDTMRDRLAFADEISLNSDKLYSFKNEKGIISGIFAGQIQQQVLSFQDMGVKFSVRKIDDFVLEIKVSIDYFTNTAPLVKIFTIKCLNLELFDREIQGNIHSIYHAIYYK